MINEKWVQLLRALLFAVILSACIILILLFFSKFVGVISDGTLLVSVLGILVAALIGLQMFYLIKNIKNGSLKNRSNSKNRHDGHREIDNNSPGVPDVARGTAVPRACFDSTSADSLFEEAARFCITSGTASTSSLQRRYSIGYNRAGRIMDQLEEAGIVGPASGAKPRKVLVDMNYLDEMLLDREAPGHSLPLGGENRNAASSGSRSRLRASTSGIKESYRLAEQQRWSQFDFVVGYEIKLGTNRVHCDICDELAGKYPKDFKWRGWYDDCHCYCASILKTQDEFLRDVAEGESGKSENEVTDVPENFKRWIKDNADLILRYGKDGTLPKFIEDNKRYVNKILTEQQHHGL